MSQTIIEMAKNATDASEATKISFEAAQNGSNVSEQTKEKIMNLVESVSEASESITRLGKSSEEIGEILSVIQDIADQTNLLALNAAIEAARAGEHGRGFSVVADEVKKLAERTGKATEEIAGKIRTNQKETDGVVLSMQKGKAMADEAITTATDAGEALSTIVAGSENVMGMVERIAIAADEQSSAAEEVSQTMENTAEIINQNTQRSEDVKMASGELVLLAKELKAQVDNFKTSSSGNAAQDAGMSNRKMKSVNSKPSPA
jgi:methyl-accepting chemotaxis protein